MRRLIPFLAIVTACGNNDTIVTAPEPSPDTAPAAEPVVDMGPDLTCTTAKTCDGDEDCDDCDDCTINTCVMGNCDTTPGPCGCCLIQTTPGCGNDAIEACVCENPDLPMGDLCCNDAWDHPCVEDSDTYCESVGGDCGCCTPHSEGGCYQAENDKFNSFSDCVCGTAEAPTDDFFCCLREPVGRGWDSDCIETAKALCGLTCP